MIRYDPTLNLQAGYNDVTPEAKGPDGTAATAQPLRPQDEKNLLNLLYWALYTRPGRDLFRGNKVAVGSTTLTPAQVAALKAAFANFNVTGDALVSALLDAHVAAELWVRANAQGQAGLVEKETQEKIYLSRMAFITWQLWEDSSDHEFSMGW